MEELEELKLMLAGMDESDPNYSILQGIIDKYTTRTGGLGTAPAREGFDMTRAGAATRQDIADRELRTRQAEDVMNLGTLGLDLYKLGKGGIQTRRSEERLRELMGQRPTYIPQRQDPRLQDAIRQATVDAGQGYSPATLAGLYGEALDTHRAADLAARTAGAGQASTYGALAQANALNRYDALRGIAADEEMMKNRKRAGLNQLISEGIREKNMIQRGLDRNFFNNTLPFYNRQLMGAEALGRAGRMNVANTLERMPADLANLTSYYGIPQVDIQAPSFDGIRDRFARTADPVVDTDVPGYIPPMEDAITREAFGPTDRLYTNPPMQDQAVSQPPQFNQGAWDQLWQPVDVTQTPLSTNLNYLDLTRPRKY